MRYLLFLIRYRQWFKNSDGLKGFAEQSMGWILSSTLALAKRLQKKNTVLQERIKVNYEILRKRYTHPTIDADEFPAIRSMLRWFTFFIIVCTLGEIFFNYFAGAAIFTFQGWIATVAKILFAGFLTVGAIILFEKLISSILREPAYKTQIRAARNWFKTAMLCILALLYEAVIIYLCKVRGLQIEGGAGNGLVSTTMMLVGMLMPVIAGYSAYEKSRFINAYTNTLTIERIEKQNAKMINTINTNKQKMENHFKKKLSREFTILQEVKTYKENYNLKNGIPAEDLYGHFCQTENLFKAEAVKRYQAQALRTEDTLLDYRIVKILPVNHQNTKLLSN